MRLVFSYFFFDFLDCFIDFEPLCTFYFCLQPIELFTINGWVMCFRPIIGRLRKSHNHTCNRFPINWLFQHINKHGIAACTSWQLLTLCLSFCNILNSFAHYHQVPIDNKTFHSGLVVITMNFVVFPKWLIRLFKSFWTRKITELERTILKCTILLIDTS